MAEIVNTTTLGYLGTEFQMRLVKCFIEDQNFFASIASIVDQNMFSDETLRKIVRFMKERYETDEKVATYFELETLIRSKISDAVTVEMTLATLEKIKTSELDGMDLIENTCEKFFKQQNLTKAINRSVEIIKKGNADNYYEIEDIIRKALDVNTNFDKGYNPMDGIEDALSEDYRNAIPTGFERLDNALYGGLAKGELGVIIAPSGTGKTSATTGFAAYAATYKCEANNYNGFKVLHIHFEDEDKNIKRKYYGFMTDIDACMLSLPEVRPNVLNMLSTTKAEEARMIKENVTCYHPQSGEMSASEIKTKIKHMIAHGFKPDLVVIDYFECLKLEKPETAADKEWTREGITMRKLESIAHEFDVALWVPIQGTKDSLGQEYVGLQQAGGSVKKVQIGHVIITFARTTDMAEKGLMNIFVQKFRGGRMNDTKMLNISFNNGTCHFTDNQSDNLDGIDYPSQQSAVAQQVADQYQQ